MIDGALRGTSNHYPQASQVNEQPTVTQLHIHKFWVYTGVLNVKTIITGEPDSHGSAVSFRLNVVILQPAAIRLLLTMKWASTIVCMWAVSIQTCINLETKTILHSPKYIGNLDSNFWSSEPELHSKKASLLANTEFIFLNLRYSTLGARQTTPATQKKIRKGTNLL